MIPTPYTLQYQEMATRIEKWEESAGGQALSSSRQSYFFLIQMEKFIDFFSFLNF